MGSYCRSVPGQVLQYASSLKFLIKLQDTSSSLIFPPVLEIVYTAVDVSYEYNDGLSASFRGVYSMDLGTFNVSTQCVQLE